MFCKKCGAMLLPIHTAQGWEAACLKCGAAQPCEPQGSPEAAELAAQGRSYFVLQEFDLAQRRFEDAARLSGGRVEYSWAALLTSYGVKYCESQSADPNGSGYAVNYWRKELPQAFLKDTPAFRGLCDAAAAQSVQLLKCIMNEAEAIDRGLAQIRKLEREEAAYDIFLCFKDMDAQGDMTQERKFLNALYPELVGAGDVRVFYSPRSMYGKHVTDFEGYIYTALKTAKLLVVAASSRENVNSTWVSSEWERFRRWNGSGQILLLPVADMRMSDFPQELSQIQSDLAMGVPANQLADKYVLKWAAKEIRSRWEAVKPKAESEPKPQPKPEPKPEPKPQPAPQPKPEPKPQPAPQPKPEPKPQPAPQPKPEPKPQPATAGGTAQKNAPLKPTSEQFIRFKTQKGWFWFLYCIAAVVAANMLVKFFDSVLPYLPLPVHQLYSIFPSTNKEAPVFLLLSAMTLLGMLISYIWDESALKKITDEKPEVVAEFRSNRWHRNWFFYYWAALFAWFGCFQFYFHLTEETHILTPNSYWDFCQEYSIPVALCVMLVPRLIGLFLKSRSKSSAK